MPDSNSSDKYTYFVTSKQHDKFSVEKLHICTWLYKNLEEAVELGFQINLNKGIDVLDKEGANHILVFTLWGSWIRQAQGHEIIDLYRSIAEPENATFILLGG